MVIWSCCTERLVTPMKGSVRVRRPRTCVGGVGPGQADGMGWQGMRDIFEDIFTPAEFDPMQAARKAMRPPLRKRFYQAAEVAAEAEGFAVRLDGKPVRTPARHLLAAPVRAIAEAMAGEWNAQGAAIDPGTMPLTRLANSIIDAVAQAPQKVAEEIANYLATDLVCYRADAPERLVTRQAAHWDPVLAFARDRLGARFVLAEGVVHVAQPAHALDAARAAIPADAWRLGALSSITTLTGSALIALALARNALNVEDAWQAAHVDEDFQMELWGRDTMALQRRAFREAEMRAAALVLAALPPSP